MSRWSIEIFNITGSYTQGTPDITTYPSIYVGSSSSSYGSTTSEISSSFLPLQSGSVEGMCLYICKSNHCIIRNIFDALLYLWLPITFY